MLIVFLLLVKVLVKIDNNCKSLSAYIISSGSAQRCCRAGRIIAGRELHPLVQLLADLGPIGVAIDEDTRDQIELLLDRPLGHVHLRQVGAVLGSACRYRLVSCFHGYALNPRVKNPTTFLIVLSIKDQRSCLNVKIQLKLQGVLMYIKKKLIIYEFLVS